MTRLTIDQVEYIRSYPPSATMCRELAQELGLSVAQVKRVLTGVTYNVGTKPGGIELPPQIAPNKLTPQEIEEIKEALKHKKRGTKTKLAHKYNVSKSLITQIDQGMMVYAQ